VQLLVRVLWESVDEKLQKRVNILTGDGAGVDGSVAIAIPDIDRLVQKNHVRVHIPAVWVPRRVLALIPNAAGAKFEE